MKKISFYNLSLRQRSFIKNQIKIDRMVFSLEKKPTKRIRRKGTDNDNKRSKYSPRQTIERLGSFCQYCGRWEFVSQLNCHICPDGRFTPAPLPHEENWRAFDAYFSSNKLGSQQNNRTSNIREVQ